MAMYWFTASPPESTTVRTRKRVPRNSAARLCAQRQRGGGWGRSQAAAPICRGSGQSSSRHRRQPPRAPLRCKHAAGGSHPGAPHLEQRGILPLAALGPGHGALPCCECRSGCSSTLAADDVAGVHAERERREPRRARQRRLRPGFTRTPCFLHRPMRPIGGPAGGVDGKQPGYRSKFASTLLHQACHAPTH